MKFTSIQQKVVFWSSIVLVIMFITILAVITTTSVLSNKRALQQATNEIQSGLISKGESITRNSARAISVFVEDFAIQAIGDLVQKTVKGDYDVVYGIYMDVDRRPWVYHADTHIEAEVSKEPLDDLISFWASKTKGLSFKIHRQLGTEIYEFVAPVYISKKIQGHVRYGLSTSAMEVALKRAESAAQTDIIRTILLIFSLALTALLASVITIRLTVSRLTKPLIDLTDAAKLISSGKYDTSVTIPGEDEVASLAFSFDQMRENIRLRLTDLESLNRVGAELARSNSDQCALEICWSALKERFNAGYALFIKRPYIHGTNSYDGTAKFEVWNQFTSTEPLKPEQIEELLLIGSSQYSQGETLTLSDGSTASFYQIKDGTDIIGSMIFEVATPQDQSEFDSGYTTSLARLLEATQKRLEVHALIEKHNQELENRVQRRTQDLANKNREIATMLENMQLGLFTVGDKLTVNSEYSKRLETILGTDRIADRPLIELLYSRSEEDRVNIDSTESAVRSMINEDEMFFEFNSHHLPSELNLVTESGEQKVLELMWNPILIDGISEKLLITIRDVTKLRDLEKQAEEQQCELQMIGEILALKSEKFKPFIDGSIQELNSVKGQIEAPLALEDGNGKVQQDAIKTVLRTLHTIKGNAKSYSLSGISSSIHDVESCLSDMATSDDQQNASAHFQNQIEEAMNAIKKYQVVAETQLGFITSNTETETLSPVALESIEALFKSIKRGEISGEAYIKESMQILSSIRTVPLQTIILDLKSSLVPLSEQLQKARPNLILEGDELHIPKRDSLDILGVLNHLLKNSLDHSIERPNDREQSGKPAAGELHIIQSENDSEMDITFYDDGRGLNTKALFEHGVKNGLLDAEPTDISFDELSKVMTMPGISTADQISDISGRGVGMDAAVNTIKSLNGQFEILPQSEKYSSSTTVDELPDFLPIKFRLTLPNLIDKPKFPNG